MTRQITDRTVLPGPGADAPEVLRTETRSLPCALTAIEIAERGFEVASILGDIEAATTKMDTAKKEAKAALEALAERVAKLARADRRGAGRAAAAARVTSFPAVRAAVMAIDRDVLAKLVARVDRRVLAELVTEPGLTWREIDAEVAIGWPRIRGAIRRLRAAGLVEPARRGHGGGHGYRATARGCEAMLARLDYAHGPAAFVAELPTEGA